VVAVCCLFEGDLLLKVEELERGSEPRGLRVFDLAPIAKRPEEWEKKMDKTRGRGNTRKEKAKKGVAEPGQRKRGRKKRRNETNEKQKWEKWEKKIKQT
jgi:hypothetical protein